MERRPYDTDVASSQWELICSFRSNQARLIQHREQGRAEDPGRRKSVATDTCMDTKN